MKTLMLLANTIAANITNMMVWFALIFFVYLETRSVATSITNGVYFTVTAPRESAPEPARPPQEKRHACVRFVSLVIYIMDLSSI